MLLFIIVFSPLLFITSFSDFILSSSHRVLLSSSCFSLLIMFSSSHLVLFFSYCSLLIMMFSSHHDVLFSSCSPPLFLFSSHHLRLSSCSSLMFSSSHRVLLFSSCSPPLFIFSASLHILLFSSCSPLLFIFLCTLVRQHESPIAIALFFPLHFFPFLPFLCSRWLLVHFSFLYFLSFPSPFSLFDFRHIYSVSLIAPLNYPIYFSFFFLILLFFSFSIV